MMLSLWMYLILCPTAIFCQWYTDFINVTLRIHKETCGLSSDLTGDTGSFENKCCGNCYNYTECRDPEKCCLSRFLSSRTNCVLPQFLTSEEATNYPNSQDVESYLMETSCPKETIEFFPMDNLKELCENPGNYNFLEAHLPVSDAVTAVHYRNMFCAYCWNTSPMLLETWQLEVHCHKRLEVSDTDILTETKNEKCNIFYKPPFQYRLHYVCTFPQYTIYRCNQSGLWKDKNELIEWACNKYYDPFNTTYKNYFCYLCNVDNIPPSDSWYCPDALRSFISIKAPHIARFELATWRSTLYEELTCDTMTEFKDYKMGVCRLIHCDLDKLRSGNVCQLRNETRPKYCPSFYVKITVNSFERNITSSRVNYWISEIEATIYQYIIPIHIVKVDLFAKSELYGTDQPLDFVVVKLLGDPYYVREAYSLNNLHRKMLTFYQRKNDIAFFEMEFHDEIIDRSGGIYIESKSDRQASWEKMTLFGSKEYYNGRLCRKRPIVQLHKTNLRPYVKLNIDEIPMTFLNGSLILNGRHLTISLSKFEYKVQNGTVFICLEDYLLFYNADLGPTTQNRASHVQSRLLVVIFIVQLFYSSFRLQRITLNDGRSIGLC